jgi:glycosyltransferase involved in cell wall biosynthesis
LRLGATNMKDMIVIEASNIYFRGGYVLLEQILDYCEENSIDAQVFIGYRDVYECLHKKKYKHISLQKTNEIITLFRYLHKREHVLFFCNLPPFVSCENSMIYAHNILFFQSAMPGTGVSLLFNLKKFIYFYWIKLFARNVDVVACQTTEVQRVLWKNLNVKSEIYPFYRTASPLNMAKEYEFCYIGSGVMHKNNKRLLDAVDRLSEKYQFRIVLTIENNENYRDLIGKIEAINTKYARTVVVNKGIVPYSEVAEIYSASGALIFPSLAETIALPLIEGLQYGLRVLSSDLPFTYQVVENPIVFNPERVDEIVGVMENELNGMYADVIQKNKITNKLPKLIQYLRP